MFKIVTPTIAFVVTIISVITIQLQSNESTPVVPEIKREKEVVICDTTSFSPENLKVALKQLEIQDPDIVYRQAVLETGSFTSNIFKYNNNLFGMKHPYIRESTSLGKNRGHAKYANWFQSVKDMKLFQVFYKPRIKYMHKDNYYNFLDDVYASDKWYTYKLRSIDI